MARQVFKLAILIIVLNIVFMATAAANAEKGEQSETQNGSFYNRIMEILKTPPKLEYPPSPATTEQRDTPIFGKPEIGKEQIIRFIKRYNPAPKLTCSVEQLVDLYFDEAEAEGIRPDLAISQAILETGYFRYGGDVLPEQNNYSGIGTTGNGARGYWFASPELGVRAHIQHLLVYASARQPQRPLADPRYEVVRDLPRYFAQCSTWESLSGKWAVPGVGYGEKIVSVYDAIKNAH